MLKKVRVHIVSERREAVGSLFETPTGQLLPIDGAGIKEAPNAEPERIEMMLEGSYRDDGARVTLTYKESELTGMEGSTTSVSFHKGSPGVISMLRDGSVKTAMVFEEARRHFCVYQTAIMPFEVCIYTKRIENALESEGQLVLDYAVELKGAQAEHNHFTLRVLPAFDRPKDL